MEVWYRIIYLTQYSPGFNSIFSVVQFHPFQNGFSIPMVEVVWLYATLATLPPQGKNKASSWKLTSQCFETLFCSLGHETICPSVSLSLLILIKSVSSQHLYNEYLLYLGYYLQGIWTTYEINVCGANYNTNQIDYFS